MHTEKQSCLYYDGQCSLCRAEVGKLQKLADNRLSFQDINESEAELPLSKDELLSELHIRQANGDWVTGLDANIQAWQHTRYKSWARCLKLALIYPLARFGYAVWLQIYHRVLKQKTRRL